MTDHKDCPVCAKGRKEEKYIAEQRAKLADQLVRAADHLIISDIERSDPLNIDGAGI